MANGKTKKREVPERRGLFGETLRKGDPVGVWTEMFITGVLTNAGIKIPELLQQGKKLSESKAKNDKPQIGKTYKKFRK